jgi:3-hydroxymyristoyl/3-hydroxydecanoyl-(acyl carrier protein) dehydratase
MSNNRGKLGAVLLLSLSNVEQSFLMIQRIERYANENKTSAGNNLIEPLDGFFGV